MRTNDRNTSDSVCRRVKQIIQRTFSRAVTPPSNRLEQQQLLGWKPVIRTSLPEASEETGLGGMSTMSKIILSTQFHHKKTFQRNPPAQRDRTSGKKTDNAVAPRSAPLGGQRGGDSSPKSNNPASSCPSQLDGRLISPPAAARYLHCSSSNH